MGDQVSTSVSIIDSLFGFQAVSLTAFDTASVPSIAAGSKVEIAGAFFTFTADEAIEASTWTAIATGSTAYILLTPAGTAGSQTVTASWTDTAPEWSDSKQGYYATAGSNIRAIGGCYKTSSTEYDNKFLYNGRFKYGDGENNIIGNITNTGSLSSGTIIYAGQYFDGMRKPQGKYHSFSFIPATLYGYLSSLIPNVNDEIIVSGSIVVSSVVYGCCFAYRTSSTTIQLRTVDITGTVGNLSDYNITAAMTSDVGTVSLAW